MEKKLNCWQFKNCNRIFNKSTESVCPVMLAVEHDGKNGGTNGGRICWQVAGSFCGGKMQGAFVQKLDTCLKCDFARYVFDKEGKNLKFL